MASEGDNKRKCFTFIWKIENASYVWLYNSDYFESPAFTVDEILETKWKLEVYILDKSDIEFCLRRQEEDKNNENVEIDCELAFLSSDGVVLHTWLKKNEVIVKNGCTGCSEFASFNEVFSMGKEIFSEEKDTLVARCRIWKSVGEMSKDMQCLARSHIGVEKSTFVWNIEHFSTLKNDEKQTYEIKSTSTGEELMTLEIFLTCGLILDEAIRCRIIRSEKINVLIQICIVDTFKNAVKRYLHEFSDYYDFDSKEFTLCCSKRELMEQKNVYLPNDILSLWCEFVYSVGTINGEIESINTDCTVLQKKRLGNLTVGKRNDLPDPKDILIDSFKSMLNNTALSDIKLKTSRQTYPAHKCILGARSPVFKAMFASDMKEKISNNVDIEDMNDDTVLRMLRYIYSAEVEDLEWSSAIEFYEAADRYEILGLKDICSSYLKSNLRRNNACESLMLADLHHDEDMKVFVQDFILRHDKDIISSEEWDQMMVTNLKLAAETMRLKFTK